MVLLLAMLLHRPFGDWDGSQRCVLTRAEVEQTWGVGTAVAQLPRGRQHPSIGTVLQPWCPPHDARQAAPVLREELLRSYRTAGSQELVVQYDVSGRALASSAYGYMGSGELSRAIADVLTDAQKGALISTSETRSGPCCSYRLEEYRCLTIESGDFTCQGSIPAWLVVTWK